ncbi:hypothetical protein ACEPPN_015015 [Leptodophora sp. 'Broadleaf-Isolate-01']
MASQPTSTTGNSWHSPKAQGQTSWDVKDPALDAESKAEWGIPPPRAIIKKSQTSYEWCMERKEKILAGHSSKSSTRVFVLPACRWCQAEGDEYFDQKQWAVPRHIHCNQPGAKKCK